MSNQQLLSVINLSRHNNVSNALRSSLHRCGAFIFAVDDGVEARFGKLSQEAHAFFQQPLHEKMETAGYSPQGEERVRGDMINKQSLYIGRQSAKQRQGTGPPEGLQLAVAELMKQMERPRRQLLSELSKILQPGQSIAKDRDPEYVSIGIHYYDPEDVHGAGVNFCPPHKDDGILTILLRTIIDEHGSRIANTDEDGLEIADLQNIHERNSGTIGKIARFVPVPSHPQHAVAWIGTAFEVGQFCGCVHKVCIPGSRDMKHKRLSIAMFCGARQS
ncbi:hypothetical protein BJX63DRAFT_415046 [Aspergillus granulosus]|uniref:Isopenicillin N synthase-like Fe(2+) 2OG dioxygenase domain-containing protein n=1 Tax=Aspergillus granulosus TaxID=176169 RepID=A0ABR4GTR1_9EURO